MSTAYPVRGDRNQCTPRPRTVDVEVVEVRVVGAGRVGETGHVDLGVLVGVRLCMCGSNSVCGSGCWGARGGRHYPEALEVLEFELTGAHVRSQEAEVLPATRSICTRVV